MKKKAEQLAAKYGGTIDEWFESFRGEVRAIAPAGYHWAADQLHVLVEGYTLGNKAEAWADLIDRMSDGIEECTLDCEEVYAAEEIELLEWWEEQWEYRTEHLADNIDWVLADSRIVWSEVMHQMNKIGGWAGKDLVWRRERWEELRPIREAFKKRANK